MFTCPYCRQKGFMFTEDDFVDLYNCIMYFVEENKKISKATEARLIYLSNKVLAAQQSVQRTGDEAALCNCSWHLYGGKHELSCPARR